MSDKDRGELPEPPEPGERDSRDDEAMRALLRRASAVDVGSPSGAPSPNLLRGVQRKIRRRSQGKFFADGWSTGRARTSYALVATVMLLVVAVAYFALGPIGITAR